MSLPRKFILLGAVVGSLLAACATTGGPESSESNVETKKIDAAEAEALFDLASECSGNDSGNFRRFDVATFDAAKVMAEVKEDDKDSWGVGCFGDHAYSTSRESAVAMFDREVASDDWDVKSCLEEFMTAPQRERLHQLVADPTNLGVFATVYDGHGDGNSEACAYYTFHVYRADGIHVTLTFNHTD